MIPFLDLKAQHHSLKEEIRKAVDRVLESGQFALGPEVEEFEAEFASYCGARHAVAVAPVPMPAAMVFQPYYEQP